MPLHYSGESRGKLHGTHEFWYFLQARFYWTTDKNRVEKLRDMDGALHTGKWNCPDKNENETLSENIWLRRWLN